MTKLGEGTGFQIPESTAAVLNPALPPPLMAEDDNAMMTAELAWQAMTYVNTTSDAAASAAAASANPPINTTCFMLTNMCDPSRYVYGFLLNIAYSFSR